MRAAVLRISASSNDESPVIKPTEDFFTDLINKIKLEMLRMEDKDSMVIIINKDSSE